MPRLNGVELLQRLSSVCPDLQPARRETRALALVLGVVLWRSGSAPATLDADLVAIAPFDVLDPELELWREGMVDLLSRNLDGAGPVRTVSPTVIVRRWRGRADRTSAAALGARTGAGLAVYGSLVGSGADSVRLAATILDVHRGQVVGEAEFRGPVNRVDRLADSLTVRVLQELGQTRQTGTANSYGLGARSLGALRAFLQAEQFFRRAEWDSARVSYERALVLDSAFALASWRLGTVYWWSWPKTNDSLHRMYALRAGALNRGLSPRDSLLVLCDSITVTLDESELLDSAARENLPRLLSTAEALVRRYPTDPDAWYVLGEARFHFEAGLGVSDQRVLAAFEQVIALDSAYGPAYDPRLERGNPPAPRGSRWRPPAAGVPQ